MYSELYAAWQQEIDNLTLQPLPSDFYVRVSEYVRRIREETHRQDQQPLRTELLERELKNVTRLIKLLTRIRYKKLEKLVHESHDLPVDLLTAEELELSKGYLSLMKGYRGFTKTLLQGQQLQQLQSQLHRITPEIKSENPKNQTHKRVTLRFIKAVPAVVGGDLKTYGPFLPEDVASVPVENAKLLVKQGFAVDVAVA
jgi:DNA replication initiation complex subunit (GINS family)